MTTLQNGNSNSRSMNGLTSIYANDIVADTISADTVETIDANISNDLNVGGTITAVKTGVQHQFSDIYTQFLAVNQEFSATNIIANGYIGAGEFRIYDQAPLTPRYYSFDATPNRHLTLKYTPASTTYTLIDCSLNVSGVSEIHFPLGINILNSRMSYETGNNLKLMSGTTNSKITLDTYNASSQLRSLEINPTNILCPQTSLNIGNSATASQVRLQGDVGGIKGFYFTNTFAGGSNPNPASVPMAMVSVIEELMDLACNCGNAGSSFRTSQQGVQFRFDSRTTEKVFQIQCVERITRTVRNALNALDTGICEIPVRLDLLSGANLTQTGTGIISQAGSGINLMKAITLNSNNDLTFQGTGKIVQPASAAINAMSAITLSSTTTSTSTTSGALIVGGGAGIAENVNIGGTLSIPSYPNVKTTLDTLSTANSALTGISYNAGTDTTTIDNNLILGNNKNLFMDGASGYISQGLFTGAENFMSNITLNNLCVIKHQDGTSQRSIYTDDIMNDTDIHSHMSGRTIFYSTYNLGNATNHTNITVGTGVHFVVAVQLIKGITYNGIGIYTGTAGSFSVGLYNSGFNATRFAYSVPATTVANRMNYIGFLQTYTAANTQIAYAIFRTTSAAQTSLYLPSNAWLNLNLGVAAVGTLSRRSQQYNNANDFSALPAIPAGQVMGVQNLLQYLVLY